MRIIEHLHLVENITKVKRIVIGIVNGTIVLINLLFFFIPIFAILKFGVLWWPIIKFTIDQIFLDKHVFWTFTGEA